MKIKVVDKLGNTSEFDLNDEIKNEEQSHFSLWIGRAETCHIVLDDMSVSREHAQLNYVDSKWIVKSDKRIMVNGIIEKEKELGHGDIITIGGCSLSVYGSVGGEQIENIVEEAEEIERPDDFNQDEEIEDGTEENPVQDELEEEIESHEDKEESQESEEFDSGYEMEEVEEEDATRVAKGFLKVELDIFGEHAPYDTYTIDKNEVIIGRDPEKCDIVLSDPEVSGIHAAVRKSQIDLHIEDLGSGNGTLLNGDRINQKEMNNSDEFVIGTTTFTVRIESDFVEDERLHLMPVEENQFIEIEEEIDFDPAEEMEGEEKEEDASLFGKIKDLFTKDAMRDTNKRKKILYILIGIFVVWILFDDPEKKTKVSNKKIKKESKIDQKEKKLTPEVLAVIDPSYQLALELFETGKYKDAIFELDKIFLKVSNYKKSRALYKASKDALRQLELMKKRERELKELLERNKKVKKILKKARQAIKERRVEFAEQLFSEVVQLDPENIDVVQLRIELEHYKKEKEKKAVQKAAREAERRRQEKIIVVGKKFYSQKKWYLAILEFENIIEQEKNMDKDLMDDVNKMLSESRGGLNAIVKPLSKKAKSLIDGKDFKGAYESYLEILKHDPGNLEALNKTNEIKDELRLKSRKVYREAIISESLSLFEQAKEKFQEVQQISPVDSEYYKKSTEKLKNYLE